jgi:hypothetical protein
METADIPLAALRFGAEAKHVQAFAHRLLRETNGPSKALQHRMWLISTVAGPRFLAEELVDFIMPIGWENPLPDSLLSANGFDPTNSGRVLVQHCTHVLCRGENSFVRAVVGRREQLGWAHSDMIVKLSLMLHNLSSYTTRFVTSALHHHLHDRRVRSQLKKMKTVVSKLRKDAEYVRRMSWRVSRARQLWSVLRVHFGKWIVARSLLR